MGESMNYTNPNYTQFSELLDNAGTITILMKTDEYGIEEADVVISQHDDRVLDACYFNDFSYLVMFIIYALTKHKYQMIDTLEATELIVLQRDYISEPEYDT